MTDQVLLPLAFQIVVCKAINRHESPEIRLVEQERGELPAESSHEKNDLGAVKETAASDA